MNDLTWAPEGREIIFYTTFLEFGLGGVGNLWRVAATGSGEPHRLAVGENGFDLTISRERHRLVYSRQVADINIWRVAISGPQTKRANPERFIFLTQHDTNPQILPDGKKVVFSSNRSGTSQIWICDHDGSNPVQPSFGRGGSASPRWSPDSRWVSFDSSIDGQFEVYVVDANGGRPRRLTSHPAADAVPSWSRDGKCGASLARIGLGSTRCGRCLLRVKRHQVTQKGGFVPLKSPDGQFVYYMKGYGDIRIWKVPS